MMSLGNIYFDKRDFEKAKKTYEKYIVCYEDPLLSSSILKGKGKVLKLENV